MTSLEDEVYETSSWLCSDWYPVPRGHLQETKFKVIRLGEEGVRVIIYNREEVFF